MSNLKLKEYWQKILSWRDHDSDKSSISPEKIWLVLVCLFFVGLVVVLGCLALLKSQISSREESIIANSDVVAEKLNEQKLKLILTDYAGRVEEFEKLQSSKPNAIDPGV